VKRRRSNTHAGDEVVGRELLIRLIEYVLSQYSSTQDESSRIRHLLQKTNLFIVPTVNPDGFNQCSRGNKNGIDLNRNLYVSFIIDVTFKSFSFAS
jgi:carboxypeptidase D